MCYHNPKTMARRIFILLTFLVLTTTALQAQTRRFVGAWFSIRYPYTFKAKGECPSESMPSKYDAATFTSPDGACTFYVFAPKGDTDEADKIMRTSKDTPTSKGVRDDEEVTFSSYYDAKLKRTCSYRMVRSKLEKLFTSLAFVSKPTTTSRSTRNSMNNLRNRLNYTQYNY